MTIRQNLNVEKFAEFRKFLADNPDKAKLTLEAKALYEGQAGRSTVHMDIDIEDLEISVKTTVDPRVLFAVRGPEDHGACLGTIEYDVKVKGDVSDEDLKTIETLCKHSPVYGMMAETIKTQGTVSRV